MTAPGPAASQTGWILLRDIMFDFDTADIRTSEMNKISEVAAYLKQNPSIRVGIDGSTDLLRGANRYNVNLSQRISEGRAHVEALANALAEVAAKARVAIDECGQIGDQNSADVFTEVSRSVDKHLWLVEAHLAGSEER